MTDQMPPASEGLPPADQDSQRLLLVLRVVVTVMMALAAAGYIYLLIREGSASSEDRTQLITQGRETVNKWLEHLQAQRLDEAYAMLTPARQAETSLEAFRAWVAERPVVTRPAVMRGFTYTYRSSLRSLLPLGAFRETPRMTYNYEVRYEGEPAKTCKFSITLTKRRQVENVEVADYTLDDAVPVAPQPQP
jgi:flagellar basal body-associated protein FliL